MQCYNQCANEAEYRIHRQYKDVKNVCSAHLYVEKHNAAEGTFTVQPLTLEGHVADYKKNKLPYIEGDGIVMNCSDHTRNTPLATQLDDKLREAIIYSAKHVGAWDDGLSKQVKKGKARTLYLDIPSLLDGVKQAFADEGYVSPENAKKVQEMVNQMANLANDAIHLPTIQYIKPNKAITKAQNLMTGQEWYDRFEKELQIKARARLTKMSEVKAAARRAAGLEERE